jgi:hypothetical protein
MPETFLAPRRVLFSNAARSWNTDGYDGKQFSSGMEVLEIGLESIAGAHPYDDVLLQLKTSKEYCKISLIRGYTSSRLLGNFPVKLEASTADCAAMGVELLSGVALSPVTDRVYILNAEQNKICCINARDLGQGASLIDIRLPSGVRLSQSSRLVVVPKLWGIPEELDPAFFISAPESKVIIYVRRDGVATLWAGASRQSLDAASDSPALHLRLRWPSAIFFDEESENLLVADSGLREIYSIDLKGNYERAAVWDKDVHFSSIAVYRLSDYVDSVFLNTKASSLGSDWVAPVLLFALDGKARDVYKVRLYGSKREPKSIFAGVGAVESFLRQSNVNLAQMLILRNGDLLLASASSSYHIRHLIAGPSDFFHQTQES